MNPKSKQQLREDILKAGKVRKASVTISQKMYSNGTSSPLETKNQDIVEIGIDALMQAFESFHTGEVERAVREARIDELDKAVKYIKQSPFAYPMLEGGFFNNYCNNRLEHLQSIESDKS